MYNLIKDVINGGNFELGNITKKIKSLWIDNSLTDDEMAELINSAQDKANYKHSMDLYTKVLELDKKVKELEEKIANIDAIEDTEDTENTEEVTYDEYVVGKWYYNGNTVSFEGANYICVAPEGQVCVWSPTEYPTYWEIVTE